MRRARLIGQSETCIERLFRINEDENRQQRLRRLLSEALDIINPNNQRQRQLYIPPPQQSKLVESIQLHSEENRSNPTIPPPFAGRRLVMRGKTLIMADVVGVAPIKRLEAQVFPPAPEKIAEQDDDKSNSQFNAIEVRR